MAKILIADDSIIMRRNLKTIFTKLGHEIVAEATNGQQAVDLYKKDEIDIVTLDITMPVMDGIEALKNILSIDPNANVIIISALDQKRMIFQALELGIKYYIIKPVTEEKIVNALNKVLNLNEVASSKEALKSETEFKDTLENDAIEEIEATAPFSIDNVNGEFIVNINSSLDSSNINILLGTLNGFLFIKPLKVNFKFNNGENLEASVMGSLVEMAKKIREAGGEVVNSPEF